MPRSNFGKQVEEFRRKAEARMRAIARESAQGVIELAQRVEAEGGTMRVKTGFLRASGQARVNGMPTGQTRGADKAKDGQYVGQQIGGQPLAVALLNWDPNKGDVLFFGWTANYARYREAKDGFLRLAVAQWDRVVADATKKVDKAFK